MKPFRSLVFVLVTLLLCSQVPVDARARSISSYAPRYRSYSSVKHRSHGYRSHRTSHPRIRSYKAKQAFLRSRGYTKAPRGYEVDHIVPLSVGGRDKPSNMQLLTKKAHRAKTAREATKYGWHRDGLKSAARSKKFYAAGTAASTK